jgi:hypothetical protein
VSEGRGFITLTPNFQLIVEMDQLEVEVDAEGGAVLAAVAEEVVHVPSDDGRLATVHLTHDDHLKHFNKRHNLIQQLVCILAIGAIYYKTSLSGKILKIETEVMLILLNFSHFV